MNKVTMSVQQSAAIVVALFGFCALSAGCADQAPRQTAKIVRQVDHVLIVSSEAKKLFSLLSDTFELPVAWPMSGYGGFASGGIAMGNVNLEIIEGSASAAGVVKSRWTGFALEPEPLRLSIAEMDARGIRHGAPAPFRSMQPDGSITTRWTTVALPDVSSNDVEIFLCQFGDDLPATRRRTFEQLRSREGGPLSIHSIKEIVYGASDVKRMQLHWQKLLNPRQESSPGVWRLGAGPALRLVQADRDGIQGLVVNVQSIEEARRFLKVHGLLGTERPGALTVSGPEFEGLNVTLVEQYSEGSE